MPTIGITVLSIVLIVLLFQSPSPFQRSPLAEPLIPTSAAVRPVTATPRDRTMTVMLEARFALTPQSTPEPYTLRWRIGVGVPEFNPLLFQWPERRPGWYLNWSADLNHDSYKNRRPSHLYLEPPPASGLGMSFVPMVRIKNNKIRVPLTVVAELAQQNPGHLWLIGNEPDVRWQDNTSPDVYAVAYHELYTTIKAADPTAQIAIGGISQVTPLRLRYLERILDHYQQSYGAHMPVDVWNIHTFILREEAGNWGVDVPPSFEEVTQGVLWEVADHDNLRLVENQVRLMRQWMTKHGERQKPLIVTEYGILMPNDYGFPPEKVVAFMRGSFDLFATLRDPVLGYSADDNRLVQRWVWFSTRFHRYPTGDLFTIDGAPTDLMDAIDDYLLSANP
ncbi:MAG: glycosyl hydrolase [Caldilineaceae bacterium]